MKILFWVVIVAIVVGLIAFLVWLSALLTMWAFNLFIGDIFHGPHIGIWHAIALNVLLGSIGRISSRGKVK